MIVLASGVILGEIIHLDVLIQIRTDGQISKMRSLVSQLSGQILTAMVMEIT